MVKRASWSRNSIARAAAWHGWEHRHQLWAAEGARGGHREALLPAPVACMPQATVHPSAGGVDSPELATPLHTGPPLRERMTITMRIVMVTVHAHWTLSWAVD